MEWSKAAEDLDYKIEMIIKSEKKPEKLLGLFLDAESMVAFSNEVYPYPHRRNSILAMIVETNDLDVLDKFWNVYFSDDDMDLGLKRKFMEGTNSLGQKMNRKYFMSDLSSENKADAEWFKCDDPEEAEMIKFRVNNNLLPVDTCTKESQNRQMMYEVLKYLHESLAVRVGEHEGYKEADGDDKPNQVKLRKNGKSHPQLIEEINGTNEQFVWQKDLKPHSSLVLYKNNEDGSRSVLVEVKNIDISSSKGLSEQVFEQLDFPEVHYWAKNALDILHKVLKQNKQKLNQRNLNDFFEIHNGILMISCNEQVNADALAYCGILDDNRPLVVFNADYMQKCDEMFVMKTLPHEFTHALDKVKVFNGEADSLSDMEVVKFALLATYMEKDKLSSQSVDIAEEIMANYETDSFSTEFVAKVMENRGLKEDKFLKNMMRLVGYYNQAKIDKDEAFIVNMARLMEQKLPHYKQVKNLYADFETWQKSKKVLEIMQNKIKAGKGSENDLLSYQYVALESKHKFFHSSQCFKQLFVKQSLGEAITNCLSNEFRRMYNNKKKKSAISIFAQKLLALKNQLLK